ncbi:PAS domain S-box-containing protein/diguanylate cyclase (GGDEF) domain-containing protein [Cohaesibacter gelatinilyticus]|uniref:PAS domain S-box-containing protein/diguanylate cyclase (GGDEF) domain-containing protein n=1 Tax=Cohaesibacter gelatinilyticus TaxID=372072 RepID=A0A285N7V3_9HYPH|nr:PAS domain S-box-containing protein/diguanylate cyclase (GGDEF) domain-containing protein [Cohaesibacter gelatinilyticus]
MTRVSVLTAILFAMVLSIVQVSSAWALEAVDVKADVKVLDLSKIYEEHEGDGDRLQVSTAPGPDGIVRRIEVRARQSGVIPGWAVFALENKTDRQVDRYLVVPHFRMSGSGLLKPDLGAQRVKSISTSQGFAPERIPDAEADVFRVTLDPGTVVTFVLEKSNRKLPGLALWEPQAYKDYVNSYTFFRGIVLGIAGLLALFLIILFVVKGAAMFPAAALLAWSVLAYLAIDFGFMGYLVDISTSAEPIWRAGAEVVFSASILILLFTYLTLHRWHVHYSHISGLWMIFLIVVLGVALFDPALGAGIARLSMAATASAGFAIILYLAFNGFDRAIMLIPTWILLLLWLVASGAAVIGVLDNDLVQPALNGGLVLLVLLFSFTIMQHAFSGGILSQGIVSDSERRALAVVGSGDIVWDWDIPRDRIHTSGEAEKILGLKQGSLDGHARDWLEILHPQDRDRFSSTLDAVIDQRRGRVNQSFRLRADDGHYRWFKLRARPVVGTDGEVVRCVGTLLDTTDQRNAEERMLHDAVHDNLTGLANRELLHDRLGSAMIRTKVEATAKPAVLLVDIDDFRSINDSYGLSIGDSLLLTVARRLNRILKPQDTIARFYGDQFAIILLSEQQPERIAIFADNVRRQLREPIVFGDKELSLKLSIGISIYDAQIHNMAGDVINDAELALYHAKRLGGDRIEPFRPSLRQQGRSRGPMDRDLVTALEKNEIDVVFQPIVGLKDRQIKGFEALARWTHAQRGIVPPSEFIPAAERTGLIVPLGIYIMEQAARQLSVWQQSQESLGDLFMSVNVSSRQLLRHDLINDVKTVLSRSNVKRGTLKLELTESLVMENPEYASQVLEKLRNMGAGLSLDDFGTGYSSLAYLQHFPFDTLKIDKSFIGQSSQVTSVILSSIVALAKDLDLNLVAEGVENEEAVSQLLAMGCPLAQGFLFGKPLTASDAGQLLHHQLEQQKAALAEAKARQEVEAKAEIARQKAEKQRQLEAKLAAEAKELERAQAHARQIAATPLPAEPPKSPKPVPQPDAALDDVMDLALESAISEAAAQAVTEQGATLMKVADRQQGETKKDKASAEAKTPGKQIQASRPSGASQQNPDQQQAEKKSQKPAKKAGDFLKSALSAVEDAANSAVQSAKNSAEALKEAKEKKAKSDKSHPTGKDMQSQASQGNPNQHSRVARATPALPVEANMPQPNVANQAPAAPVRGQQLPLAAASQAMPAPSVQHQNAQGSAVRQEKTAQQTQSLQQKSLQPQVHPSRPATDPSGNIANAPVPQGATQPANRGPAGQAEPDQEASPLTSGKTTPPQKQHTVGANSQPVEQKRQKAPEQPPQQGSNNPGQAVPSKDRVTDDSDLPFAMPDMSGIDQDIAAAIANAMKKSNGDT